MSKRSFLENYSKFCFTDEIAPFLRSSSLFEDQKMVNSHDSAGAFQRGNLIDIK